MTDQAFELLRSCCIEIWESRRIPASDGEPGNDGYIDDKITGCRERANVDDNYIGLIGQFDSRNSRNLRMKLHACWNELEMAFHEARGVAL